MECSWPLGNDNSLSFTIYDPNTSWNSTAGLYQVDPLVCPKCKGIMRIISFIEDRQVIRDILTHLGLWFIRSRPPPKIHDPLLREYAVAFGGDMLRKPAGIATCPRNEHSDMIYGDPQYSWDDYIQS